MWFFTKDGAFSATEHRGNSAHMLVQASDRESLIPLSKFVETEKMGGSPRIYKVTDGERPYRMMVNKKVFSKFMTAEIENISYHSALTGKSDADILASC